MLLYVYPLIKITAILTSLCGVHTYKNYKNLTLHQQNVIANLPSSKKGLLKDLQQSTDLIDTFTKANQKKQSFDNLYPNENSSTQPKKNESVSQYKKRNQKVITAYECLIFEEIDPILEKYIEKHTYPTKTELINDIFKSE